MNKIYYLAHPYSPQDDSHLYSVAGREQVKINVDRSIEITNELLDKGYSIFNPLTHSHSLDEHQNRTSRFWYDLDLQFLTKCDGMIMAPEWSNSKGCRKELKFALINIVRDNFDFEIIFYEDMEELI